MNKREYLYTCAMEDCANIQKNISEILINGEDRSDNGITNGNMLMNSYYHLQSVINMLIEENILIDLEESEIISEEMSRRHYIEKRYKGSPERNNL